MGHQWQDVDRGILFRTSNVKITDEYRPLLGVKEAINGLAAHCTGDGCELSPCRTYMIHKSSCRATYSPGTDGGMQAEDCG